MSARANGHAPPSRLPGFYRLSLDERRDMLKGRFGLDDAELSAFEAAGGLLPAVADKMVENAVGVLGMPLGLGLNFVVNGEAVLVPMAVEEPSVVAACGHIASLALNTGGFEAETDPPLMVGQIQVLRPRDPNGAVHAVRAARERLMAEANGYCAGLKQRGGGCVDVEARRLRPLTDGPHADLDNDDDMLVVDVVLDCRDAMGANAINSVAEGLAPAIAELTGGEVRLRILTNLSDRRCARASMALRYVDLAGKRDLDGRADPEQVGREVAEGIVDAFRFAARDPYRACTHNKGIMNGVDAVAIATGNDWRALEAGAHSFAARSGQYTSLTRYWLDDDDKALRASIEIPMAVGTVGGATRVHPTVAACRKLLGPFAKSASRLGMLMAAVGLSQNCGALKALATEGIQRGHMSLHARQVALAAGAEGDEVEQVARELIDERCFRTERAAEILAQLQDGTEQAEARA